MENFKITRRVYVYSKKQGMKQVSIPLVKDLDSYEQALEYIKNSNIKLKTNFEQKGKTYTATAKGFLHNETIIITKYLKSNTK